MIPCLPPKRIGAIACAAAVALLTSCGGNNAASPFTEFRNSNASASRGLKGLVEYPVPIPSAYPIDIVEGPDGNLWFAQGRSGHIGRITSAGSITEYPISGPAIGIASGPGGKLWFSQLSRVGSISTKGKVTYYRLPALHSCRPLVNGKIGVGPDSTLWFGTFCTVGNPPRHQYDAIMRLTSEGEITTFMLEEFMRCVSFVTGPDGAVWSTCAYGSAPTGIGRITTAGIFTFFQQPTETYGAPFGITNGPDGALWFTDNPEVIDGSQEAIGRITTKGKITLYPIPSNDSLPYDIVTGPGDNLWFTESYVSKIGTSTGDGVITEFQLKAGRGPYGITNGPSGTIWFTEASGNNVAKFTP